MPIPLCWPSLHRSFGSGRDGGAKQQSSVASNCAPTQLSLPQRSPGWQSESRSQSPSPSAMLEQPLSRPLHLGEDGDGDDVGLKIWCGAATGSCETEEAEGECWEGGRREEGRD